jgi:hypothetical protein
MEIGQEIKADGANFDHLQAFYKVVNEFKKIQERI